ncbi:MAG: RdgB/HAM1 family non-canonical purine NTP pyrophosphatase [Pirellula sp.]|nr:RdgB/HAM1 family non-canonical purine NTP pyrophosphatase [Pirellula sp.]
MNAKFVDSLLKERVLLLGTSNRKKVIELEAHLLPRGFSLKTPKDYPEPLEVEETGETFIENARIKAIAQSQARGVWAIGEDSGLCVPALGGQPGVISARFSGPGATDQSNNSKLLQWMENIPEPERVAYYVSTVVLSDPDGQIAIEANGECWGRILRHPRGNSGFGYDPLFEVPEYHRTFAELGLQVKRAISHRSRALRLFLTRFDAIAGQASGGRN